MLDYKVNTWQYDSKDKNNPVKVYHQVYLPDYDVSINISNKVNRDELFETVLDFLNDNTNILLTNIYIDDIVNEILDDREELKWFHMY